MDPEITCIISEQNIAHDSASDYMGRRWAGGGLCEGLKQEILTSLFSAWLHILFQIWSQYKRLHTLLSDFLFCLGGCKDFYLLWSLSAFAYLACINMH